MPLFDDSKFRQYHLYEDGTGTIRIIDYENTPFEFFKVKWTFESDTLTIYEDDKVFTLSLKMIDGAQWIFDIEGKEICLVLTFDSYTFRHKPII